MRIKCLDLSKLFFSFYLFYKYVLCPVFSFPLAISYVLLPVAVIFFLLYKTEIELDSFSSALVLFLVYCAVSGLILAKDVRLMLVTCMNLTMYTVVFWLTLEYSLEDKSIDFAVEVLLVWALFYAAMILLFGVGSKRVSISEDVNVNGISRTMVFAIGFKLYRFTKGDRSRLQIIVGIVEIVLFLYTIALTVSKMAIICALLMILLWLLFCSAGSGRDKLIRKGIILFSAIAAAAILFTYFKTRFPERYAYILFRMSGIKSGNSSIKRLALLKEAAVVFSEHPFLGVGLNNFTAYSGYSTYSHCFYAEIPVCTGIVGTILMFTPLLLLFINLIIKVKAAIGDIQHKQALLILIMFILFLIVLIVQICIYSPQLMFILAILNAAVYTELDFSEVDLPLQRAYELPFEGEIHAKKENTD